MLPWRFVRILVALVSGIGSIILTTFLIVQSVRGVPVPPIQTLLIWVGIGIVAFVVAGFTVWRDEHEQVVALKRERSRPDPTMELRRGPFNDSVAKLAEQQKTVLRAVWTHGRRDAIQIERAFRERGKPLGTPGGDALSSANLLLVAVEEKTGLIRVVAKGNAFGTYEVNPDMKPLLDEWVQQNPP